MLGLRACRRSILVVVPISFDELFAFSWLFEFERQHNDSVLERDVVCSVCFGVFSGFPVIA